MAKVVVEVLNEQGRGTGREGCGHARAAHVGVRGVVGAPTDARGVTGFCAQDPRARCGDVWLQA